MVASLREDKQLFAGAALLPIVNSSNYFIIKASLVHGARVARRKKKSEGCNNYLQLL
jgi:hypothetical protein